VGNLSTGGTGKTPVVRWLAETLSGRGERVAIVTRGYGGDIGKGPFLASSGEGALAAPARIGDEPWMLAETLLGTLVVVGSNRVAGAAFAAARGASLILLDDGFQHRRLDRDFDIVLLDQTRPFWNDRLLPQGRLREPLGSLKRASAFIVTRSDQEKDRKEHQQHLRAIGATAPVYAADHQADGFFDSQGVEQAAPRRAIAFCGIGNPDRFKKDLETLGVTVCRFYPLRDHQPIPLQRLHALASEAATQEATLVTTEKDLARIGHHDDGIPLLTLRISLRLPQREALLQQIDSALQQHREPSC
jgi:tetraacyldisaccharide 4'-kinase